MGLIRKIVATDTEYKTCDTEQLFDDTKMHLLVIRKAFSAIRKRGVDDTEVQIYAQMRFFVAQRNAYPANGIICLLFGLNINR